MPWPSGSLGKEFLPYERLLSLEPATISQRRYPELFQQAKLRSDFPCGRSASHNFFMELAAEYDYKLSENTMLSFYAAPMGDPAMGPVAYPHRASASEDPIATLGHHLEDSTHISAMSSQWVSRAEISDWRRQVSTGANRTNTAGIWLRADGFVVEPLDLESRPELELSVFACSTSQPRSPVPERRRSAHDGIFDVQRRPMRKGNWDSTMHGTHQSCRTGTSETDTCWNPRSSS